MSQNNPNPITALSTRQLNSLINRQKKELELRQLTYKNKFAASASDNLTMFQNLPNGAYQGATSKKVYKNWYTEERSTDREILPNLKKLRERANDLYNNDAASHGTIKTLTQGVTAGGLELQATMNRDFLKKKYAFSDNDIDELEDSVEMEWDLFSESAECDFQRRLHFSEIEELGFLNFANTGESIVTLPFYERAGNPFGLKIALISSSRLQNPNNMYDSNAIAGGIETNRFGEIVAYHILDEAVEVVNNFQKEWKRIPAFGTKTGRPNLLHIFRSEKVGQRRGLPFLYPVMEELKQSSRFSEAALAKQVISQMLTVFITHNRELDEEEYLEAKKNGLINYELGPGAVYHTAADEDVKIVNPNLSENLYDSFLNGALKRIGMGTGIPFEVLAKQFMSSYSASRAAQSEAWRFFLNLRKWYVKKLHKPVYKELIMESVARKRIDLPGFFEDPLSQMAYLGSQWLGFGMPQMDPYKEAKALEINKKNLWATDQEISYSLGHGDIDKNYRRIAREKKKRIELGLEDQPVLFAQPNQNASQGSNSTNNPNQNKNSNSNQNSNQSTNNQLDELDQELKDELEAEDEQTTPPRK